jgi:hypothetical protein
MVVMMISMTSCTGYSDDLDEMLEEIEKPQPKPEPEDSLSLSWTNVLQKYHKVYSDTTVVSTMIGQRENGELDTLSINYCFVYELCSDTTIMLDKEPADIIATAQDEISEFSDFFTNEQKDSVCYMTSDKQYNLSNNTDLFLHTKRVRAYHMVGGQEVMYSEPTLHIGELRIGSSVDEFERNDSIFGIRTSVCVVPLYLDNEVFDASATITEVWFKEMVQEPEPSYDYKVEGLVKYLCASKVYNNTGWSDGLAFEGTDYVYFVIENYNKDGQFMGRELQKTAKSRLVVNEKVNAIVYDFETGLYATALIVTDKTGWNCEGFIDGRSIVCDRTNVQAIEEGIKNFSDKDTSVPTPFFVEVSSSVKEWQGKVYITASWSKRQPETDLTTKSVTVAEK